MSIADFVDDDAWHLAWLNVHPNGYVINTHRAPTSKYVVLHRASCHTIGGVPPPAAITGRRTTANYVHRARASNSRIGRSCEGSTPTECSACSP